MSLHQLTVCHDCDTAQVVKSIPAGAVVRCVCCDAKLIAISRSGLEVPLALSLATMVFIVIANCFPFIHLDFQGNVQSNTLFDTSLAFIHNGQLLLAFVVLFSTIIVPGLVVFALNYVLFSLHTEVKLPYIRFLLHITHYIKAWAMLDVFFISVLVAMVKLFSMADVEFGVGLYAFIILIFLYSAALSRFEPHILWERIKNEYQ